MSEAFSVLDLVTMRLTSLLRVSTSLFLRAKKPKAESVIVDCKSLVSGYHIQRIRPRLGDKLEFMCWDPLVRAV